MVLAHYIHIVSKKNLLTKKIYAIPLVGTTVVFPNNKEKFVVQGLEQNFIQDYASQDAFDCDEFWIIYVR